MAVADERDIEGEFDDEFAPGAGASRGWRIAAAVAVVAALGSVTVLLVLLLGGGSDSSDAKGDVRACVLDLGDRDFTKDGSDGASHPKGRNCPPAGAHKTDGLVKRTDDGGFTIRRIVDGKLDGTTVELHVRKPDRRYIDIAHAQTHAALGQPIRVYTERIDGRESVIYMEDAPLLG